MLLQQLRFQPPEVLTISERMHFCEPPHMFNVYNLVYVYAVIIRQISSRNVSYLVSAELCHISHTGAAELCRGPHHITSARVPRPPVTRERRRRVIAWEWGRGTCA